MNEGRNCYNCEGFEYIVRNYRNKEELLERYITKILYE